MVKQVSWEDRIFDYVQANGGSKTVLELMEFSSLSRVKLIYKLKRLQGFGQVTFDGETVSVQGA